MVQLAKTIGVGRASLYRALDTLEKSGAIARQGKQIWIRDKEKLFNL